MNTGPERESPQRSSFFLSLLQLRASSQLRLQGARRRLAVGGEEMREIPGHPGYFATRDGKIVSRKKGVPRTLSPRKHSRTGHLRVRVYVADAPLRLSGGIAPWTGEKRRARYYDRYVHTLVCMAWNGPCPRGCSMVLHLDDDPENNRPENLRWGVEVENAAHRSMDPAHQLEEARKAWAEWVPWDPVDSDGFDWFSGEFK